MQIFISHILATDSFLINTSVTDLHELINLNIQFLLQILVIQFIASKKLQFISEPTQFSVFLSFSYYFLLFQSKLLEEKKFLLKIAIKQLRNDSEI